MFSIWKSKVFRSGMLLPRQLTDELISRPLVQLAWSLTVVLSPQSSFPPRRSIQLLLLALRRHEELWLSEDALCKHLGELQKSFYYLFQPTQRRACLHVVKVP